MDTIKPTSDRVLVRPLEAEKKVGGIFISTPAKSEYAEVVAVGPGRRSENGCLVPMPVKVGDIIVLPTYGGLEITRDGVTYQLLHEAAIEAIVINFSTEGSHV